ncbi:MAG: hypothetical protein L0Z46_07825 [Nitrospiraceae bacterium]|nr:hypothetical protein [Nitrospiraceae bacterium]
MLWPAVAACHLRPPRARPSRDASTFSGATQYDDFEILGVFTSPEKFKQYVEKRFPKTTVGSRWRTGDGEWRMSTPTCEYVASELQVDDETTPGD